MSPETVALLEQAANAIKRERNAHRAKLLESVPEDELTYVDDLDGEIRQHVRHMLATIGLDDWGGCRLCLS